MILKNAKIVLEDKVINKGWLEIEQDKIISIHEGETNDGIDLKGNIIMPGFIDCHVHGGYGVDFESGTVEAYNTFAKEVAKEGITKYCLGSVTNSDEDNIKYFGAFKIFMQSQTAKDGAVCLGCHLEGPFISPDRKGAHELSLLRNPNIEDFKTLQELSGDNIRVVTYANDLQDGSFTKYLTDNKIIPSMGHTNVSYNDCLKDLENGANHVTHLFNAMSGVDHRVPGLATFALNKKEVLCEVISDSIHVDKAILEMIYKTKGPEGICIITDAMNAKGLPDGEYKLGNLPVIKDGMKVYLKESGVLAGAGATYDHNVRVYHEVMGMPLYDLSKMTSTNISKQLGIYEKTGSIAVNKLADIVILSDKLEVIATLSEGSLVFGSL